MEAEALWQKGQYHEAEALCERALDKLQNRKADNTEEYGWWLNLLGLISIDLGQYNRAEALYKKVLIIIKVTLDKNHHGYAASFNNLATLYRIQGRYDLAEPLLKEALSIIEVSLGKQHPFYANSLNNLAGLYQDRGWYDLAEPLYKQALFIRATSLGKQHPSYAQSLSDLANLYKDQGRYKLAEGFFNQALLVNKVSLGKQHPNYGSSLNSLALLYQAQGRYNLAKPLFKEALSIREATLGKQHPFYATSLNNLALLLRDQSRFEQAEPLFKQALSIIENSLGKQHPDYAQSLNNLALLYQDQGRYNLAEPLLNQSCSIIEASRGKQHPHYASCLITLAVLYKIQGRYIQAEALYRQALFLLEATLGKQHPTYATSLNNLALLYQAQSRYLPSERLFKKALSVYEASLGKQHPHYATTLNSLATVYQTQGRYDLAEPLLKEALSVYDTSIGKLHSSYATPLNNLATLYKAQGRYDLAEPLFKEALSIREASLGKQHPHYANSLDNLAYLFQAQHKLEQAWAAREEAQTINFNNMLNLLNVSSNNAVQDYLNNIEGGKGIGVTAMALASPPEYHPTAFNWVLRSKALEVDILSTFQQALHLQRTNPAYNDLITLIDSLSAQLDEARRLGKLDDLQALEDQLDQRQQELRRKLGEQNSNALSNKLVTYQELQPLLKHHHALYVDIVRITPYNFQATTEETRHGAPIYVAFILQPQGPPTLLTLGDAKNLESVLTDYQQAFSNGQHLRTSLANQKTARALTQQQANANYQEQARKIYDFLVKPLQPYLASTKRLFLSPDAAVSQVPFEALLTPDGHYLGQSLDIVYLTSGRDLLKLASNNNARSLYSARIFSGPDYNLSWDSYQQLLDQVKPAPQSPPSHLVAPTSANSSNTMQVFRSSATDGFTFSSLKGASKEGEQLFSTLASFLPTLSRQDTFFQDDRALEDWLKGTSPPDILHLATHGFSVPNHQEENPLLRSGLALAGANTLPKSPNAPNDGILYAQEAALLNLKGTDLVVLSACETAKGEALPGKGVYNLNRAFLYAGANTVISSLHSVHDEATQKLMTLFYENLLDKKMTKLQALQEAKKTMQHDPNFSHPFFWASFILVGNPN